MLNQTYTFRNSIDCYDEHFMKFYINFSCSFQDYSIYVGLTHSLTKTISRLYKNCD